MKYLWILLLLAALTSTKAQFNCFSCQDCEYLNRDLEERVQCGEGGITETTTMYTGPPTNPSTMPVTAPPSDATTVSTELPTAPGNPTNPPEMSLGPMAQEETTTFIATTLQSRRHRRNLETFQSTHRCFTIRVDHNATHSVVNRGCVRFRHNDTLTCGDAAGQSTAVECKLCDSNLCNGSRNLVASISVIFISLFVILRF